MGTSFYCWSLYTSVLGSVESLIIVIHESDERIVQGLQKNFQVPYETRFEWEMFI